MLYPAFGGSGVAIAFAGMYLIVAVLTYALQDASGPGERRSAPAPAVPAVPVSHGHSY